MTRLVPMLMIFAATIMPSVAPAASIDAKGEQALIRALEDEYHAEAFYDAVIAKFGAVRPFVNIIEAERKHAAMVAALMQAYGIDVPANDMIGMQAVTAAVPPTLGEACRIGVEAEITNRDLYLKELMPSVAGYPDIVRVFDSLQAASQNNHLPAFQRCADRN